MNGEWREVKLGDLCHLRAGSVFKLQYQGYTTGDYPFIKVSDMNIPANGIRIRDANNWVDKTIVQATKAKHFPLDTIVFAKIGEALKQNRLRITVRPTIIDNNMMGAIPKKDIVDPKFLFYGMHQFDFGDIANGTALPYLTVSTLTDLTLLLPPLSEQRAIAHVLGTLDDKIELNRRMNETLEEMARALFKSWFVDFEPVRAKMEGRWRRGESLPGLPREHYHLFPDRLVPSELGEIPEGWEVKELGDFGEIVTGKTPSTRRREYYGEDVPFLRIPDMRGNMFPLKTELMLSTQGVNSQPQKTLPPGSISVSCIATPGLVVLNHRETQTNQQINSIIPYDLSISRFLYWTCKELSSDIKTGGLGGSVFGNMNKSTFSALPALYPEPTLTWAFDNLVSSLHTAVLTNEEQGRALVAQRDALLPKLVSGGVRIAEEGADRDNDD